LKTGEAASGILKLLDRQDAPDLLAPYVTLCERLHKENNHYPGSPAIAAALTRPDDNIILMELHPVEYTQLKKALSPDKRVHVHHRDGFSALVALSPPVQRRGLALIDPSYETDEEYLNVAMAVSSLTKRWPEAVIAVWYPLVQRRAAETAVLKKSVASCAKSGVLCTELCPAGPGENAWGLYGSGMLIVNPPWKTDEQIAGCLPWIRDVLAVDSRASTEHGWIP